MKEAKLAGALSIIAGRFVNRFNRGGDARVPSGLPAFRKGKPVELPTGFWTSHCHRLQAEHAAGWITRAYRDVGLAIARLALAGDVRPTVAKIAVDACCEARTVRRARAALKARGLLEVAPRFELVEGRRQQRASENRILLPAAPLTPKPKVPRGGQTGRPSKKDVYRKEEGSPLRFPESLESIGRRRMVALGLAHAGQ
jgi:hypothetical protein